MAGDAMARDASADLGEQARADEAKSPAEAPPAAAPEQPAASPATAAPKSGKRRFVLMGIVGLLALAAASYAAYYLMVGRFYISTDDAYVRANNTMLGARVAGHIAAILPGDNALVRAGDVIFRIDDGDYRIAVDAARTRIATQQATIERIGRQVAAAESSVEQAQAQLVSAQAGLKRADLDYDRQQALTGGPYLRRMELGPLLIALHEPAPLRSAAEHKFGSHDTVLVGEDNHLSPVAQR